MAPMSQQPDPDEPAPEEPRTRPGEVTKTRKYLWVIGGILGLYLILSGLWEMFTTGS